MKPFAIHWLLGQFQGQMTSNNHITPRFVEFMPKDLESNTLYISKNFNIAAHLCPCGCGNKIITPLNRAQWEVITGNGKVSLSPSINNGSLPCRFHYWIRNNRIVWANKLTDTEFESRHLSDRMILDQLIHSQRQNIFWRFWKRIRTFLHM